jgi:AraC family transcriptional regulator
VTSHCPGPAELGIFGSRAIPGFSIKDFRQPPHRRLPWHEHTHASICFVVSGSYAEHVRGRVEECPPRSMIFKPAAERHADIFGRSGARCVLVEVLPGRLETSEPFSELTAKPGMVRSARLAALGQRLCGELAEWDVASPLAAEGLILEVLADAARVTRDDGGTKEPRWLRRARELIHEHIHEPLTLSAVARAAEIHPSHLARTFRKHHGRAIGDYVRALRIERAARDIAETDRPLSEIGLRFGFFDQSHFSRVFKRHMGMTPAEFRARSSGTCTPR